MDTMSEPTVEFGQSSEADYNAVARTALCVASGGKRVRGGVVEKRRLPGEEEPAAKRRGTNGIVGPDAALGSPPPPPGPPPPPATKDADIAKVADGLKLIDSGLRGKAADIVGKNLWKITGTGAASMAASCMGPGWALLPPIVLGLSMYSDVAAIFVASPRARTIAELRKCIEDSKAKAKADIERVIAASKGDTAKRATDVRNAIDRLAALAKKADAIPAAPAPAAAEQVAAVAEEVKEAVAEAPPPSQVDSPAAPVAAVDVGAFARIPPGQGGRRTKRHHRRHRLSAPTRKARSSSSKRKRYTRQRRV